MAYHKSSSYCNFRDMNGTLIAVEPRPNVSHFPAIGSIYRLKDKLYVVGGIAFVNGRLNINLDKTHDSKRADTPKH